MINETIILSDFCGFGSGQMPVFRVQGFIGRQDDNEGLLVFDFPIANVYGIFPMGG